MSVKDVISRRQLLRSGAVLGLAGLSTPYLARGSAAAETLVIRTLGGAYEDAAKKVYFAPFTKETGIEIRLLPTNFSKLLAMHRAGSAEIDVIDIGEIGVLQLGREGALAPIAYDTWKSVSADDIDKEAVAEFGVGHTYYSTVIGYNKNAISPEKAPKSWVDFWNVDAFPGPRMLADIASGSLDLEQALLADGVKVEDLYPIDVPRALNSLKRIRPHIRKFWDTGALSAQMLTDQEAVMGSIWNTRLQAAVDAGAPLGIEWNGGMLNMQSWSIAKGSRNMRGAQRFVEFAMAPERQAALCALIPNGPTNKRSFERIAPERAAILPSNPEFADKQFHQNVQWWADNRSAVAEAWSKWLLENR